jgi:esterase/lipase superfamily enzyme
MRLDRNNIPITMTQHDKQTPNMKNVIFILIAALTISLNTSHAAQRSNSRSTPTNGHAFGLGIILGSPTGFTGRYTLEANRSLEGIVGWSFGKEAHVQLAVSHLWTVASVFQIEQRKSVDLFFGVGGSINNELLGVRAPVGLSMMFSEPRIEAFAQVALNVGITPSTRAYMDGGIGVRYYF